MSIDTLRTFPPVEADRQAVDAPIQTVTLLEDRAMVHRSGTVTLQTGMNRLLVLGVAPVVQDVSARGEVSGSGARVADVRVRRAMRALHEDKPEELRTLIDEARAIESTFRDAERVRTRAVRRHEVVHDMLVLGLEEIPQDAAWGHVEPEDWRKTFETLFLRTRELQDTALEQQFAQQDCLEELVGVQQRFGALSRPDWRFAAWIELDVLCDAAGEVTIELDYVVPNALWRPVHTARLEGGATVDFACSAAVWQQTGEDWTDAQLVFSTARASLGIEPPLLSDDLITAQRKAERVLVARREVAVQRAGVAKGGKPSSNAVDLPGVDDGGETRNLRAPRPATVPSDGRPYFVPLFRFASPTQLERVATPELDHRVFLKCTQDNTGDAPILAGPVALVRDHGHVGWTTTLFVAPGEAFELGFGPDEDLRISRRSRAEDEEDPIDDWKRSQTKVWLYASNLGAEERAIQVTERIPVSEIAEVKVHLDEADCTGDPVVDEDGFVVWKATLPPYDRAVLTLAWTMAVAPGVEGM